MADSPMLFSLALDGTAKNEETVQQLCCTVLEQRKVARAQRTMLFPGGEILFEKGGWHISTEGKRRTKRTGLSLAFSYEGTRFESADLIWTFEHENENRANCSGTLTELPFAVAWCLTADDEGVAVSLSFMSQQAEIVITGLSIETVVSSDYSSWVLNEKSVPFGSILSEVVSEDMPIGEIGDSDKIGFLLCDENAILFSHFSGPDYSARLLNYRDSLKRRSVALSSARVVFNDQAEYSFHMETYTVPRFQALQQHEQAARMITYGPMDLYCTGKELCFTSRESNDVAIAGLTTYMVIDGKEQYSSCVRSSFRKVAEDHMQTTHFFSCGEQMTDWSFNESGHLACTITFDWKEDVSIETFQLLLSLPNDFENAAVINATDSIDLPSVGLCG